MKIIKLILFLWLILIYNNISAQSYPEKVTFKINAPNAERVSVAGSFNNWDAEINPLIKNDSTWIAEIYLDPGYYYYKFVVDDNWTPDPANDWKINDGGDNYNSIIKVGEPERPQRKTSLKPLPKFKLPKPILEKNPEWIELYYAAWTMAWNKIAKGTNTNGFVKRYMDEGFNELIFQWDTNFMVAFEMYARNLFPAIESLDNFYKKQREDGYIQRVYFESNGKFTRRSFNEGGIVNEPTKDEPMVNPPLFAWIEMRYYKMHGDQRRLRKVLPKLVSYYNWIEENMRNKQGLYFNTMLGSGMDNTPRDGVGKGSYIDMSAQQALAAKSISQMAAIVRDVKTANKFSKKYGELFKLINEHCWNNFNGFYYDTKEKGGYSSTKHIGAFWTLLSEVSTTERKDKLIQHLTNPEEFWRPHLIPTLSGDDPNYDDRGHYWLGSVWAPTNYMVVKGLEKYGKYELAYKIAENHISNMSDVFHHYNPDEENIAFEERYGDEYKTIWECYSPEYKTPATRWDNTFYSRQDFVGWSGLGPISMLIENVIGLELVGNKNLINWRIHRTDKHGIEKLLFKDQQVNLICTPHENKLQIEVKCSKSFSLNIFWKGGKFNKLLNPGYNIFTVK